MCINSESELIAKLVLLGWKRKKTATGTWMYVGDTLTIARCNHTIAYNYLPKSSNMNRYAKSLSEINKLLTMHLKAKGNND